MPKLTTILALVAVLGACASPPAARQSSTPSVEAPDRPTAPKRITAAILSEPPTFSAALNPANAAGSDALEELVNAGLAIVDIAGQSRPQLAEALPSIEHGTWRVLPDGRMETTWKLRPSARWHDGTPLTAADLVFTAEVGRDRELPVFRDVAYDLIEGVEAVDPATVMVRWRAPYIDADMMFTRRGFASPLPRHLLERPYQDDKAGFTQLSYWNQDYIGLGPFKLKDWVKGSHIRLEANSTYALGRPLLDEVEVRFFLDSNTLIAHLLAGTVYVTLGRGLSLEQALGLRDQWREGRVETSAANAIQIHPQMLNPTPAVVGDVRLRRALLHAIDRQAMVETLEAGMSGVAHAWVSPSDPDIRTLEPSIIRYDYDPRQANRLLEEVGFTRSPDGQRDTNGQRLTLEIRTTESNDIQPKSMFPVADYWQQIGVGVEALIVPRQRAQDREYRATYPAFELIRGGSDPRAFRTLRSSEVRLPENSFTGGNYARYANPELDTLIERYLTTIPRPERLQLTGQILRHMTDRVVVLGLFYDTEATAINNRLTQATARHKESTQAWNAHLWDLTPGA